MEEAEFSDPADRVWVDGDIGKDNLAIFIRIKNVWSMPHFSISTEEQHVPKWQETKN